MPSSNKNIIRTTCHLLQESYTEEAVLLLQAAFSPSSTSLQQDPIDNTTTSVEQVFDKALKKNRSTSRLYSSVQKLLKMYRLWTLFQDKVIAQNIRYLTFWIEEGRDLIRDLRKSRYWKEVSDQQFITEQSSQGNVILVSVDTLKDSFRLDIRSEKKFADKAFGDYPDLIDDQRLITNEDQIPGVIESEIPDTSRRALASGAKAPLEFVGAGMTGIVYKDATGTAYKVGRHLNSINKRILSEEYEWFKAANSDSKVAPHVAKVYRYDPRNVVLVREHIDGYPGAWSQESSLRDLMLQIDSRMRSKHGWSAPEFKGDSFIYSSRGPILVDASMPHRFGHNLVEYVAQIVQGKRRALGESNSDLAFYLRRELMDGNISREQVGPLLEALGHPLSDS